jgi:hypothetical protein
MIENDYFKGKHYDVGIAEVSHPSQYAFAVFDALRIKHLVVSRGPCRINKLILMH